MRNLWSWAGRWSSPVMAETCCETRHCHFIQHSGNMLSCKVESVVCAEWDTPQQVHKWRRLGGRFPQHWNNSHVVRMGADAFTSPPQPPCRSIHHALSTESVTRCIKLNSSLKNVWQLMLHDTDGLANLLLGWIDVNFYPVLLFPLSHSTVHDHCFSRS
jgi:hypothetical protein